VVAIETDNHSFSQVKRLDDLGKTFLLELEKFFVNYHQLSGKQYRILAAKGPAAARRAIKGARANLR
jgi:inorganic pyrophosphatase